MRPAVSWLVGPGFAIGAGSFVSPVGTALGPLPAMDARTLAFFIDKGPAKMIETPASSR